MPIVTNRGQRIHYTTTGSGPTVILQHGLLSNAESWSESGYVAALADTYQVVCVDSLGHGQSDKPADSDLYLREARATDVLCVADEVGAERFHLVGYSMGGWIATMVAVQAPERLQSLTLGGWDLVDGPASVSKAMGVDMNFNLLLAGASAMAPELTAWVTDDVKPGLQACWDQLTDLAGAEEAVDQLAAPVLLWNGDEDPYHSPMQQWAKTHQAQFLSVPGDHIGAIIRSAKPSIRGLLDFMNGVRA